MEENVKIYNPKKSSTIVKSNVKTTTNANKNKSKWESRLETISEIFNERDIYEKELIIKYPCFNVVYNWIIAVLLVILLFGFVSWGIRINTDRKAAALTATAMAEYQAEQDAQEEARLAVLRAEAESEETILENMAKELARVYYGADRFKDKYGYSEADFNTLGRCVVNRVENKKYSNNIFEVIGQESQWVGYYPNNPVLDYYYNLAYNFLKAWRAEAIKPISTDFVFAEFTPQGIFLKSDFNAGAYAVRWRSST